MGFTHNFLLACVVFLGTYPPWAKDRRDPTSEASTTPITIRVYVPLTSRSGQLPRLNKRPANCYGRSMFAGNG